MTLDEQIKWLADEAAKKLAAAGRRDAAVQYRRGRAVACSSGDVKGWYEESARNKERQGQKLREEAATMLTIENSLRQLKAAQEVA